MNKIEVETVVRLHTPDAVLEVGTDADTGSCVEIRTPDARSREWYGDIRLALPSEVAVALAHTILKVAGTLESSVPVGVVEAFEEYHKADHRDPAVALEWEWWQAAWKAAVAQQPAADGYCITREDGECVSSDLRCMHNKPAAVDEATRRDAKRYRWLRIKCGLVPSAFGIGQVAMTLAGSTDEHDAKRLDAHIDAAMNGANT